VGYRYGEHRYGQGRYSRWPDWWHTKDCQASGWQALDCAPPVWQPSDKRTPTWTPSSADYGPNLKRGRNVQQR
jgi:hypothetical protein